MVDRVLSGLDKLTLYLVNSITEDTTGDSIDNELRLAQYERQFLVISVTGEEYQKLFTSVMEGADLIYNDESHQITWLLWKAAKNMTLCQAINQCLLASGGGASPASGGDGSTIIPSASRSRGLIPDDWTCDEDHAFGMARAIVESLHDTVRELMEQLELTTNVSELAAEVADNYPVISWGSSALDVVNWLVDTLQETYVAAWSDVTRDEIACSLMCKIMDGCNISYDDIYRVYSNISFPGVPDLENSNWDDWVGWFLGLNLAANVNTVKAGGLAALAAVAFGSKVGTQLVAGIRSLELIIKLSVDEVSNEWDILCDECPPDNFSHYFDLENEGASGWVAQNNQMIRENVFDGNGLNGGIHYDANNRWLVAWCQLTGFPTTFITDITAHYALDTESLPDPPGAIDRLGLGYAEASYPDGNRTAYKLLEASTDQLFCELRASWNEGDGTSPGGHFYIRGITVTGEGADPFI